MSYPKGTKFNRYVLTLESQRGKNRHVIRRWVFFPDGTKKLERLPIEKYLPFRNSPEELEKFVIRLNAEMPVSDRVKAAVEVRHAFISPELLENYFEFLNAQLPTQKMAKDEFFRLKKYFLGYFINQLNLKNPLEWHRVHKTQWANYLRNENEVPGSLSLARCAA